MEQQAIENTIRDKARKWAAEYGEDFVIELAGDFLATRRRGWCVCAKRWSAAMRIASIWRRTRSSRAPPIWARWRLPIWRNDSKSAGRNGDLAALAGDVNCFERQFAAVKASLEKMLSMPGKFLRRKDSGAKQASDCSGSRRRHRYRSDSQQAPAAKCFVGLVPVIREFSRAKAQRPTRSTKTNRMVCKIYRCLVSEPAWPCVSSTRLKIGRVRSRSAVTANRSKE